MFIQITNFRSVKYTELALRPGLNILVGSNGSGKTCLLAALKFLRDVLAHGVGLAMAKSGGAKRNYRRGTNEIVFHIVSNYGARTIGAGNKRCPFFVHWHLRVSQRGKEQLSSISEEKLVILYTLKSECIRAFEASISRRKVRNFSRKVWIDTKARFGRDLFKQPWNQERRTKADLARDGKKIAADALKRTTLNQDRAFLPRLAMLDEELLELCNKFRALNEYNILPEVARQSSDQLPIVEMQPNGKNLSEVIYTLEQRNYHRLRRGSPYEEELDFLDYRLHDSPFYYVQRMRYYGPDYRRMKYIRSDESLFHALADINRDLAAAVRPIDGVAVEMDQTSGKRFVVFRAGRDRFYPEEVSDGTMKWLCILVSLYVPFSSVYLLEEPENFLHPWMQQKLIRIMRQQALKNGATFILTSHSATILNAAKPDEVVLVRASGDGTQTETVSSKEEILRVLSESSFGLGDLWVSGAIGGVPADA